MPQLRSHRTVEDIDEDGAGVPMARWSVPDLRREVLARGVAPFSAYVAAKGAQNGCIVAGATVRDSLLFAGVRVEPGTLIESSVILPGAEPFLFRRGRTGCLLLHGFTAAPQEVLRNLIPKGSVGVDGVSLTVASLDDEGLTWIEEPFWPDDYAKYKALAEATSTPIAGGEEETTLADFERLIGQGHVEIVQPDVTRAGGIGECLKIADYARRQGRRCILHAWSTGIIKAATLHVLAAMEEAAGRARALMEARGGQTAVANFAIKSGTNQLHGEAHETVARHHLQPVLVGTRIRRENYDAGPVRVLAPAGVIVADSTYTPQVKVRNFVAKLFKALGG